MIPCERSSGKRQRLGKLTKEGSKLLRYLWTEATLHAVEQDAELKRFLSSQAGAERNGKSQDRSSSQTGNSLVDHAARSD
jgi:hypothetical protein